MKKIENLPLVKLMRDHQARLERSLAQWLPDSDTLPAELHEAMRYAVLNGGKRVRAVLVYATGQALDVPSSRLDGPACTVEIMHAYSLIHDDLPAMDDAELRRGKPACHKAFDEATAILAGDAMQALAFYILAHDPCMTSDPARRLEMIENLALAVGSRGMAGGQAIDLAAQGKALGVAELENMHIHKTGALIRACVRLAALSGDDGDDELLARLDHYAKCVGLAFQIRDDILDVESDTETLGKRHGADKAQDKPTYPAVLGLAGAKQMARELHEDALESLSVLDERANPLRWLSTYIVERAS